MVVFIAMFCMLLLVPHRADAFPPTSPKRIFVPRLFAAEAPSTLPLSTPSLLEEDDADFERRSRIHNVIGKLRFQIPNLLRTPLTGSSSKSVYEDSVKIVVAPDERSKSNREIILASSRAEVVTLSETLVLAMMATIQANSIFSLWGGSQAQQSTNLIPIITGDMVIDPALQAIRVKWQVQLPGGQGQNNRKLKGISELILDEASGKVTEHCLRQVQWNNEDLNARAIGESLANLRQFVVAFQKSPVLQSFLPKSVLSPSSLTSLLGPDFMQQLAPSSSEIKKELQRPKLYVVESLESSFVAMNGTATAPWNSSTTPEQKGSPMIPIDEYNASLPLPGSTQWQKYSRSRNIARSFVLETLPALAGTRLVSSKEMVELFCTHATLMAADGSELLRGRDQLGNFFHTVSSWRKRSSGNWTMLKSTVLNSDDGIIIAIDFRETSPLPGSSTHVIIQGTDEFTLVNPTTWWDDRYGDDSKLDEVEDQGYNGCPDTLIQQVKQRKLVIGDGSSPSSLDGIWFIKGLISALDTGRFSSVGGDSVVMDLLQRVIADDMGGGISSDIIVKNRPRRTSPPKLSQAAAARVYNIMATLHHDLPLYFDEEYLTQYQLPPCHEFMAEAIELRGYLGETLARGSKSYNSVVGATLASLKGTVASGSVHLADDALISTTLTATGDVRLSLTLDLRVLPLLSGAANAAAKRLLNSMGMSLSIPSGGFPLKIELVSDYLIDKQSGGIYLHQPVETRVNGRLTPGDIVSKWVQTQVVGGDGSADKSGDALLRGLLDTVSWVRSMGRLK